MDKIQVSLTKEQIRILLVTLHHHKQDMEEVPSYVKEIQELIDLLNYAPIRKP